MSVRSKVMPGLVTSVAISSVIYDIVNYLSQLSLPRGIRRLCRNLCLADKMCDETQLIRRSAAPEALEFPLEALDGPITPNELFFVRNHYETPLIRAADW